jgi:hypothetical protein
MAQVLGHHETFDRVDPGLAATDIAPGKRTA